MTNKYSINDKVHYVNRNIDCIVFTITGVELYEDVYFYRVGNGGCYSEEELHATQQEAKEYVLSKLENWKDE